MPARTINWNSQREERDYHDRLQVVDNIHRVRETWGGGGGGGEERGRE